MKKIIFLTAVASVLTGCGGSSSDNSNQETQTVENQQPAEQVSNPVESTEWVEITAEEFKNAVTQPGSYQEKTTSDFRYEDEDGSIYTGTASSVATSLVNNYSDTAVEVIGCNEEELDNTTLLTSEIIDKDSIFDWQSDINEEGQCPNPTFTYHQRGNSSFKTQADCGSTGVVFNFETHRINNYINEANSFGYNSAAVGSLESSQVCGSLVTTALNETNTVSRFVVVKGETASGQIYSLDLIMNGIEQAGTYSFSPSSGLNDASVYGTVTVYANGEVQDIFVVSAGTLNVSEFAEDTMTAEYTFTYLNQQVTGSYSLNLK